MAYFITIEVIFVINGNNSYWHNAAINNRKDNDEWKIAKDTVGNSFSVADEGKVVVDGKLVSQTAKPDEITENGTIDTTTYDSVTVNVSGGGGSVGSADVNFYDYDGTIVNSYTAAEFADLSALPENPTHEGLTAQGWNWSLADAQAYVADYGLLNLGQMYITDDSKTRIYISLHDGRLSPYLGLTGIEAGTTVTIDWGDGSNTESVSLETSTVYTPHIYATEGKFVITVNVNSGRIKFTGNSSSWGNILICSASPNSDRDRVYLCAIEKIELGSSVASIENYAFRGCTLLKSITIPNSVTSIGDYALYQCYTLQSVIIPNTVTSIGTYAIYQCYALQSVIMPNTITSIGTNAFTGCSTLQSVIIPNSVISIGSRAFSSCSTLQNVVIPNTVTSIGEYTFSSCSTLQSVILPNSVTQIAANTFQYCQGLHSIIIPNSVTQIGQAFSDCMGMGFIKFESNTPPTVSSSYAFGADTIPNDCIIYVPTGTLSKYKSARYYPNPSSFTYIEY